jgi:hypothetical protein
LPIGATALMWVQGLVAFGYDIMIIGFKLEGSSRSKNKLISIDYKKRKSTKKKKEKKKSS